MICNVCGDELRCLELCEFSSGPPPLTRAGMRFRICVNCLTKLIAPIATDKTILDDPKDFEISSRAQMMSDALESARKIKDKKNP